MKKVKILLMILAFGFVATSCDEWIDPEINSDPDANADAPVSSILAQAQVQSAYVLGGADFAAVTGIWNQHIIGLDRQFSAFENYNVQSNNYDNPWSTIYSGVLVDCKMIIELSGTDNPHYSGAAKVIAAYTLGTATSVWGDIPFSDALRIGEGGFKVEYDTQESIYSQLDVLLTEAITELSNAKNVMPLSQGDMIYGGNTANWIKAAYALKARYALHLTEKGGTTATVTTALANAFDSNADNFELVFGTSEENANPLYQFRDQREGYAGTRASYEAYLGTDPRAAVQTDNTDEGDPITFGSFFASINSPVPVITYPELLFIEAEVAIIDGNNADQLFKDAVEASLNYYGVFDQAWFDANIEVMAGVTLQDVMEQKYIHMFMQPEAFMDIRRTGFPVLTPTSGTLIPRRFPYPQDEKDYNTENVPAVSNIYQDIWLLQ